MDPFVRKLVLRLFDEGQPLSRNKHFHTFATTEGKRALQLSKRLRALRNDIEACREQGGQPQISRSTPTDDTTEVRVEITLHHLRSKRLTSLDEEEFELLKRLPGMRELL